MRNRESPPESTTLLRPTLVRFDLLESASGESGCFLGTTLGKVAIGGDTRRDETIAQTNTQGLTFGNSRNHERTKPLPNDPLQVLVRPEERFVVEHRVDQRFDRRDPDEPVLIPKALLDEPAESLEPTSLTSQVSPRIA